MYGGSLDGWEDLHQPWVDLLEVREEGTKLRRVKGSSLSPNEPFTTQLWSGLRTRPLGRTEGLHGCRRPPVGTGGRVRRPLLSTSLGGRNRLEIMGFASLCAAGLTQSSQKQTQESKP